VILMVDFFLFFRGLTARAGEVFVCAPPGKLLIAQLKLIRCILAVSLCKWILSDGSD
jgi:hypothetical protein